MHLANANPEVLVTTIDHLSRRQAKQIVSSAKVSCGRRGYLLTAWVPRRRAGVKNRVARGMNLSKYIWAGPDPPPESGIWLCLLCRRLAYGCERCSRMSTALVDLGSVIYDGDILSVYRYSIREGLCPSRWCSWMGRDALASAPAREN